MPFDSKRYPANWKQIRAQIQQRAGNQCERCEVPNRSIGFRNSNGEFHILAENKENIGPEIDNEDLIEGRKIIEIVCTTAHIGPTKHDKMDCRPEVLLFLCQRCHLREDGDEHRLNAADTRKRKKLEAARNAGQIQLVWP